jgi:CRISPR system Cascade subunit CasD
MQSWGTQSRFGVRETELEPSKSGVIGLLCAALGRPYSAPVDDLANLRMGVRIDREGKPAVDYHVAQNIRRASATGGIKGSDVSTRHYLEDAAFLVGLEGDVTLLNSLQEALKNPYNMLCLGRKAFVPGSPVWLKNGLRCGETLEEALNTYPCLCSTKEEQLRIVLDDPNGQRSRTDVPISFAERKFSKRRIQIGFILSPQTMLEIT